MCKLNGWLPVQVSNLCKSGNWLIQKERNSNFEARYFALGLLLCWARAMRVLTLRYWLPAAFRRGFYRCTLKKDVTLLRTPQKLVVTYIPSLELFFSLTPFRRHLLLTVGNGSGE